EKCKITGIDFTDSMLEKARRNVEKLGFANVEFIQGDIEEMPLENNQFDVIVSNCVLNLVPDKNKAFSEMYRVLKQEGHFCVSDVVIKGELPEKLQKDAEMYAGCVSGAIDINEYLGIIRTTGFSAIEIHKQKEIELPVDILKNYLTDTEILKFRNKEIGIFSITVSGTKNNVEFI
ncbi:MAG: methyltransferase domain-containing protein, partial [Paludibacter sp.]